MRRSPFLRFPPPVWLLIFLCLAFLIHYFIPAARIFDVSNPAVATIVMLLGILLTLWSGVLFRKEDTEILPTSETNRTLITYGPYALSRNPIYLGGIVVLFGVALYGGTLPFFLAVLAQYLLIERIFIPFEEEKMARQFGERYDEYRRNVRRWI